MGCQQSQAFDPEDSGVEAIRYTRRRPTNLKRSKRKKSSKKNGCHQVSFSPVVEEVPAVNGAVGSDFIDDDDDDNKFGKKKKKKKKKKNERAQMFGNKGVRGVLTMSVDTPEAAEMEAKQGKFGNKHVFPVWEVHVSEPCKCSDTNNADGSAEDQDEWRRSSTRLCSRCLHVIVNNKKRLANNNNSSSNNSGGAGSNNSSSETNSGTADNNVNSSTDEKRELSMKDSAKDHHQAAIANLLALAALDLSAPASTVLAKNRKNAWIQLAGHPGSFAPAGPNTIWKKRISKENYEVLAYTALKEFPQSKGIMPAFHREVEFNGEYFIEMEDLLHHFNDPSIMDIKMGTRTFLEVEVKNPVLRKDLYEKMVKVDPSAPTEQENAEGAVTKLRYMQFREQESSTANLGFRIEAIRMSGEPPNTNLKKVKTKEEVSYFLETFLHGHEVVMPALYEQLREIRDKFESITFFNSHEVIGSSLLIMYDNSNHAGAWMIDFAKTIPLQDTKVDHRSQWQPGNHEDGYLIGIENLVEIFQALIEKHKTPNSTECQ